MVRRYIYVVWCVMPARHLRACRGSVRLFARLGHFFHSRRNRCRAAAPAYMYSGASAFRDGLFSFRVREGPRMADVRLRFFCGYIPAVRAVSDKEVR